MPCADSGALKSIYPKWVLARKKLAAQKISGQYLQNLAGDL